MDKIKIIKTEAKALLDKMISKYELEVNESEGACHVIIKTEEDAPTIIGHHGETIRALQKILEVVLYKKTGEAVNILVNVNDYREKQKERLEELASQLAVKAQSIKEAVYFRGLSSYERKIIHEYVTNNYPDLTTYSVGEGRDRRLVIDIKK
jgi:spoIIIJ-associated protein